MRYARVWLVTWSVVGVVGAGLAVLGSPWGRLLLVVVLAVLLAVVLRLAPARVSLRPRPFPLALVVTAGIGYAEVAPALALLLALGAVLSSPPVVRAVLASHPRPVGADRRDHRVEPPVENPGENPGENPVENPSCLTGPEVQGPLVALDDRQLCRLWRQSFWELRDARLPENRLRLVLLRQACLDELIRRHGQGVEAWLHSGARASSGPDKFLGGHGAA